MQVMAAATHGVPGSPTGPQPLASFFNAGEGVLRCHWVVAAHDCALRAGAGAAISTPSSTLDVVPTILGLARVPTSVGVYTSRILWDGVDRFFLFCLFSPPLKFTNLTEACVFPAFSLPVGNMSPSSRIEARELSNYHTNIS